MVKSLFLSPTGRAVLATFKRNSCTKDSQTSWACQPLPSNGVAVDFRSGCILYAPDIENLTRLTSSLFVIKERSRWTTLPRSRGHSSVGRERVWSLVLLSGHGGQCLQPRQKSEVAFRYITCCWSVLCETLFKREEDCC